MTKISIVIPAYNEEKTISEIIRQIKLIDISPLEKEIIVVDNNSKDATLEILKSVDGIKIFSEKEKGKGSAVKKGIMESSGDFMIIQDADLEYNPSDIPKLIKLVDSNKTAVYGSRNMSPERKGGILARIGVWFLTKEFNLLFGTNLTDLWTCYKLFPREASIYFKGGGFESELSFSASLVKNGYKIIETPISYNNPRTKAEGKKIRYHHGIFAIFILIKERFRKED